MADYEKLTRAGLDMESLIRRLMGNESLVRIFIKKFTEDQNWAKLQQAFADRDMEQAEMASHTLKGMCGNLSVTELYGLFTEQVNLIRSGEYTKAEAMMPRLTASFESTIGWMKAWLADE